MIKNQTGQFYKSDNTTNNMQMKSYFDSLIGNSTYDDY